MKRDKETFLQILEANKGIIFKICNTYSQNLEDQKDLVQDVIIQLWRSFEKYDETYKLTTWIYRIALNVAISDFRKRMTRKKYSSTLDLNFVQIVQEEGVIEDENIHLLRKFIGELDELNKALMILYLDGNSHEEIAKILDISTSNVGTKISRIKQKLKVKFEKLEQ